MELKEALPIIQALVDGIDPHTGEVFPDDSPYQHPQTIRALFTLLQSVGSSNKKQPNQAGEPWDEEEGNHLREAFQLGQSIKELAESHARSEGAIRSRLKKLGFSWAMASIFFYYLTIKNKKQFSQLS